MAHELLVLGTGCSGRTGRAAHHARERSLDLRVTLVNAASDFVERVRLHQVAAGQKEFIVAGAYGGLRGGRTRSDLYPRLVRWSGSRFQRRHRARARP